MSESRSIIARHAILFTAVAVAAFFVGRASGRAEADREWRSIMTACGIRFGVVKVEE